jgi:ACR3 family arsenite efflux pump ArsB
MRWRLLILTSLVAAFVGFCIWEAAVFIIFASTRPVEAHPVQLMASTIIPLITAAAGAMFVYRHSARRRKTQAAITVALTVVMFIVAYATASRLYPPLAIPKPCRVEEHCA